MSSLRQSPLQLPCRWQQKALPPKPVGYNELGTHINLSTELDNKYCMLFFAEDEPFTNNMGGSLTITDLMGILPDDSSVLTTTKKPGVKDKWSIDQILNFKQVVTGALVAEVAHTQFYRTRRLEEKQLEVRKRVARDILGIEDESEEPTSKKQKKNTNKLRDKKKKKQDDSAGAPDGNAIASSSKGKGKETAPMNFD